jgi:hypothetical protein
VTYWTAASAAELDVLLWALADSYFTHRDQCARCAGPLPCPHVARAIDEVLSWRTARQLLDRAQALRAEQEERAA